VIESLGIMCPLLTRDHFDGKLPQLLPVFLGMYKKEPVANHVPISQGLCSVFAVATQDGRYVLEKDLPIILGYDATSVSHPLNITPSQYHTL
jgi:hypothetical protein